MRRTPGRTVRCPRGGAPALTPRRRAARGRRRPGSRSPTPSTCRPRPSAVLEGALDDVGEAVLGDPLVILAVLEHRAERGRHRALVELADAETSEGRGPVDGLGDTGRLVQVQLAERGDGGGDLAGEGAADLG